MDSLSVIMEKGSYNYSIIVWESAFEGENIQSDKEGRLRKRKSQPKS